MITKIIGNIEKKIAVDINDISKAISGLSNYNFLINPWFTINTKNINGSHYHGNNSSADGWYSLGFSGTAITTSTSSDGISIASSGSGWRFYQDIPYHKNLSNKTITVSFNVISGPVPIGVYYCTENDNWVGMGSVDNLGLSSFTITLPDLSNATRFRFMFQRSSQDTLTTVIKAIKLEIGSISTLANDQAPSYFLEMVRASGLSPSFDILGQEYETGEFFLNQKVYAYAWDYGYLAGGEVNVALPSIIANNMAHGVDVKIYCNDNDPYRLRYINTATVQFPKYDTSRATMLVVNNGGAIGRVIFVIKYTKTY